MTARERINRKRRIRRIRRNRRIAVICCLLLCSVIISMTCGRSEVKANQDHYKYYTDVYVRADDTLWSIASEYYTDDYADMHDYICEVMQINSLLTEEIHYGDTLIVPYYSAELK